MARLFDWELIGRGIEKGETRYVKSLTIFFQYNRQNINDLEFHSSSVRRRFIFSFIFYFKTKSTKQVKVRRYPVRQLPTVDVS
jgi:hypothetical protein